MKKTARYASVVIGSFLIVISAHPCAATPLTWGSYRWRADDGTEATASFSAPENTRLGRLNRNFPQRLRFAAGNDGTQSELLEKASAALMPGEDFITTAVLDPIHGYAYFGTNTIPATVVKVRLGVGAASPVRLGELTFDDGENQTYRDSMIDVAHGYAYFGVVNGVVKIALGQDDALPTIVGFVPFEGESGVTSGVIDTIHGYAYFGTGDSPANIFKISLGGDGPPVLIGSIPLQSGEENLYGGATIDPAHGYAYFGTGTYPGKIVKIALGEAGALPSEVGALPLPTGENWPLCSVIDPDKGYAYFCASDDSNNNHIVKIDLNGDGIPTRVGELAFADGEQSLLSATIDTTNGYGYFGVSGKVIKVALGVGSALPTRVSTLSLGDGVLPLSAVIDPVKGYAYFETWDFVNPGNIVKVSIAPHAQFRLEYAPKVTTCSAIVAGWTQVPTTATTEAFQMYDSANLTDGDPTTHIAGLADLNTSFQPGQVKDTSSETASISLGEKQFTELEYSIEATNNAPGGTNYCFRLSDDGTPTPLSVANYAEVTVMTGGSSSGGGGNGGVPVIIPASVTLSIPQGGETYASGAQIGISWSSANGAFTAFRVSYSSDNGNAWSVIATVPGSSYTWTVPAASTTQGLIKVEGLNSTGTVLASSMSTSNFTVKGSTVAPPSIAPPAVTPPATPPATDPTVAGTYDSSTAKGNNPNFNTDMGLSAKNQEPISNPACVSGTLIKGSLPAVYYCGANGKRYVFVNDKAYFSWYPDFSTVQIVSDATLANIMIGGNITYRPGTRMVKIQSDPKVYVVARGGVLRWVETEAAAVRLFGANWNTMIDDVSDSFFVNYTIGAPIAQ